MLKVLRPLLFILVSVGLGLAAPWRPEPAAAIESCRPPQQAVRTYVGFPDGLRWQGRFEPAALEAKRILSAAQEQSCSVLAQQGRFGTLHTALQHGAVAITAILFRSHDLGVADVHMERIGSARSRWSLRVVRAKEGDWQVMSAERVVAQHRRVPAVSH